MDDNPKVALQKIIGSLHSTHEILENILDRAFDDKVDEMYERLNLGPKDGLKFLALGAHNIHELAKEVEFKLSGCMEMQRKEKSRMESKISSLMKENEDISSMLKIAVTEKEAAENSLRILKDDRDQRKSAIQQIAERGLQKVGFGFIMEVIGGESESEEMSSSSANTTSNGRENEEEVVSLVITSTSLTSISVHIYE